MTKIVASIVSSKKINTSILPTRYDLLCDECNMKTRLTSELSVKSFARTELDNQVESVELTECDVSECCKSSFTPKCRDTNTLVISSSLLTEEALK